jgi:hypothetical protein
MGMRFELASRTLQFRFPDQEVAAMVQHLLRYHNAADSAPQCVIQLVRGDFDMPRQVICLQKPDMNHSNEWIWGFATDLSGWTAEHFFYWVLSPLLSEVLAELQIARLHGAMLCDAQIGTVLFLGDRGAGKSSTVAAWLESGGTVLTDDTLMLRENTGQVACYGLRRELHVDPALSEVLRGLPALDTAKPYLPGKPRLAYDWVRYFPEQQVDTLPPPEHIIHTGVLAAEATTATALTAPALARLVTQYFEQEPTNALLAPKTRAVLLQSLQQANGWNVRWGADIWQQDGKHVGFLRRQLSPSGAQTSQPPTVEC